MFLKESMGGNICSPTSNRKGKQNKIKHVPQEENWKAIHRQGESICSISDKRLFPTIYEGLLYHNKTSNTIYMGKKI